MIRRALFGAQIILILVVWLIRPGSAAAENQTPSKPIHVIYGTDLFHPHDDADDHYDLASLFAITEFQIDAFYSTWGIARKPGPGAYPWNKCFN